MKYEITGEKFCSLLYKMKTLNNFKIEIDGNNTLTDINFDDEDDDVFVFSGVFNNEVAAIIMSWRHCSIDVTTGSVPDALTVYIGEMIQKENIFYVTSIDKMRNESITDESLNEILDEMIDNENFIIDVDKKISIPNVHYVEPTIETEKFIGGENKDINISIYWDIGKLEILDKNNISIIKFDIKNIVKRDNTYYITTKE